MAEENNPLSFKVTRLSEPKSESVSEAKSEPQEEPKLESPGSEQKEELEPEDDDFDLEDLDWGDLDDLDLGDLDLGESNETESVEPEPAPIAEDQTKMQSIEDLIMIPAPYRGVKALKVVAPGSLGRWILERTTALGLMVTVQRAERIALPDDSEAHSGLWVFDLCSEHESPISRTLVRSLSHLPYVVVAQVLDIDSVQFWIDANHRLPLSSIRLSSETPENEMVVLGPPDIGSFRLHLLDDPIEAGALMQNPTPSIVEVPRQPKPQPIQPIPCKLVPRPHAGQRIDAVLLDEMERQWLRPFLMSRPTDEASYVLPGNGCTLLTAPGGLPMEVPFGTPLVRIGPGGLYLELGLDFFPPLPVGARQTHFQVGGDAVVAVVREATYRFNRHDLRASWTLWIKTPPAVQKELPAKSAQMLAHLSQAIRDAEAAAKMQPMPQPQKLVSRTEQLALLEQAQQAELAGDLIQAAECLEQAGHPGPAGRLYEQAARQRG